MSNYAPETRKFIGRNVICVEHQQTTELKIVRGVPGPGAFVIFWGRSYFYPEGSAAPESHALPPVTRVALGSVYENAPPLKQKQNKLYYFMCYI